jgi:hypothetical protein
MVVAAHTRCRFASHFRASPISLAFFFLSIVAPTIIIIHFGYQRHVGILEKIVQSLLARSNHPGGTAYDELELQYKAQLDVMNQWEDKLTRQIAQHRNTTNSSSSNNNNNKTIKSNHATTPPTAPTTTQWTKLQRDHERIQARVAALRDSVARRRPNGPPRRHLTDGESADSPSGHPAAPDYEQQQQLQLEQDVSLSLEMLGDSLLADVLGNV